jgi:hypothetical protein
METSGGASQDTLHEAGEDGGLAHVIGLLDRISDIERNLDEDSTLFDEEGNLVLDFNL